MKRKQNAYLRFCVVLALFLGVPLMGVTGHAIANAATTLDLGNGQGAPESTVTIPITLTTGGAQIAATSNDITYDTAILENPQATIGPAGEAADKSVVQNTPSEGVLRVGVLGFNINAIGDGIVAYVSFSIKADAALGDTILQNSPSAADTAGNPVAVSGSNGTITVAQNHTIVATVKNGTGGTISPSGSVSVPHGGSQTFNMTPDSAHGYVIQDVKADSVSQGAIDSYTFTDVIEDHTIEVTFALKQYTIRATAGANGSISPSGVVKVTYGSNKTFRIVPRGGYHVSKVLVDGRSVGAVTKYVFENVTRNHTISALFARDSIVVTSPNGGESWAAGSKHRITWTYTGKPGTTVKIELLKKGVASSIVKSASLGANGQGSYLWQIPRTQAKGTAYKVRVTSRTYPACTDSSNNNFSITAARRSSSAGPDQTAASSTRVKLSAANTVGKRADIKSFRWSQLDGPSVKLSNPLAVEPAFVTPAGIVAGESIAFELTVTGTDGSESKDFCIVNVSDLNAPPVAEAGVNQITTEGGTVTLDGSDSSDPQGGSLSAFWKQVSGTPVTLSDPESLRPVFTAPDVAGNGDSLVFELTVANAAGLRSRDTCVVNAIATHEPPQASAGMAQTVIPGSLVALDGSGSSEPDGGVLRFCWRQTGGSPVVLSNPEAVNPSFTAPGFETEFEHLTFELTVTGRSGLQDKDRVVVTVERGPSR
mgnify:FL=1